MANIFYDYVISPLESLWRAIREFIDLMATWAFALWPDHRPAHTLAYQDAQPGVYVAQRARVASFVRRRRDRLASLRAPFLSMRWAM